MPRIPHAAAVAVTVAVAVPSVADAATLYQDGRTPHRVLLQDATGETNLVTVRGSQSVLIEEDAAQVRLYCEMASEGIDLFSEEDKRQTLAALNIMGVVRRSGPL